MPPLSAPQQSSASDQSSTHATAGIFSATPSRLSPDLAARIIGILDDERLSTRKAEARTGVNHADCTRIRNVQLDRFTIDRLMIVLNKLGRLVDVRIDVHPRAAAEEMPASPAPVRVRINHS